MLSVTIELYFIHRNWHIWQCLPICGPRNSWWKRGYHKCPEKWHIFPSSLAAPSKTLIFLLYRLLLLLLLLL